MEAASAPRRRIRLDVGAALVVGAGVAVVGGVVGLAREAALQVAEDDVELEVVARAELARLARVVAQAEARRVVDPVEAERRVGRELAAL